MKRILIFIVFISLAYSLQGQMIIRANSFARAQVASNSFTARSAEYDTVYSAMTTKPTGDTATWQDDMVYSLDSAGYFDRMDVLYIFATTDNGNSEALINWIHPGTYNATNVSSTSWTALEGFTGDGAADYLNTNYNPSTGTNNFVLNSGTLGIYIRTNVTTAGMTDIGARNGGTDGRSFLQATNGTNANININQGSSFDSGNTNSNGFYIMTRTGATTLILYENGSAIATGATPSDELTNRDIYIGATNDAGTANSFSTRQYAIAFAMNGCSSGDVSGLNTIFERYMDRLGKGVQ